MLRKILRRTFLLGGILLLSVFVVVQPSWGCDDTDKWDCDRHDKWACDDHDIQCHPPKIQIVYLGFDDKLIYFTILGKNFDNGAQPVVTLGGTYDLTVVGSVTENQILATYPITGFEYGDYRLVVSTCHDSACRDKYCKDHGPNCRCKYCRDHCSKCKDKYCKDKYCKDHEYKCKCKDQYSLTIAGPAGPPGPPAKIGSVLKSNEQFKSAGVDGRGYPMIEGIVNCPDEYTATGGGFMSSSAVQIIASEPLKAKDIGGNEIGIGWHVVGVRLGEWSEVILTTYAICVQLQ